MAKDQFKTSQGAQFVQFFGPVLDALRALGGSGSPSEVTDKISMMLKISSKQQEDLMESGSPRFANQVAWARFYLTREGLLDSSRRGVWSLTDKGREKKISPDEARAIFLKWVKIYAERRKKQGGSAEEEAETASQPELLSELSHRDRLLALLRDLPPSGFEKLCQRLLREAGFTQVTVTGRSGDEGIDGVGLLQINPFVSFQVLFQCKRYKKSVVPSQVRDFRGAMEGRADKGIIITTGTFTADARKEALRDGAKPIELVNSQKLIEMFENLELGLKPVKNYEVDEGFFEDFREGSAKKSEDVN